MPMVVNVLSLNTRLNTPSAWTEDNILMLLSPIFVASIVVRSDKTPLSAVGGFKVLQNAAFILLVRSDVKLKTPLFTFSENELKNIGESILHSCFG